MSLKPRCRFPVPLFAFTSPFAYTECPLTRTVPPVRTNPFRMDYLSVLCKPSVYSLIGASVSCPCLPLRITAHQRSFECQRVELSMHGNICHPAKCCPGRRAKVSNPLLSNISLKCVTFVYAVGYLFNAAKMCCILLCSICLTL